MTFIITEELAKNVLEDRYDPLNELSDRELEVEAKDRMIVLASRLRLSVPDILHGFLDMYSEAEKEVEGEVKDDKN